MTVAVKYPDSTKASLQHRLADRARERWPQIDRVMLRRRGLEGVPVAIADNPTNLSLNCGYSPSWDG
jgi:hypothetical protein